ncbi:hypothetical protein EIP91_011038 [Steccherinum ochraceum]|uniref:Uncharacterized protein n=1 Tax=Steccherinum ochraceum TaxID=92696 RepID=A0A4R0QZZ4_9APHY|nr:hypothetical protein EIP91_011038 [Steccherinum ochraceum]
MARLNAYHGRVRSCLVAVVFVFHYPLSTPPGPKTSNLAIHQHHPLDPAPTHSLALCFNAHLYPVNRLLAIAVSVPNIPSPVDPQPQDLQCRQNRAPASATYSHALTHATPRRASRPSPPFSRHRRFCVHHLHPTSPRPQELSPSSNSTPAAASSSHILPHAALRRAALSVSPFSRNLNICLRPPGHPDFQGFSKLRISQTRWFAVQPIYSGITPSESPVSRPSRARAIPCASGEGMKMADFGQISKWSYQIDVVVKLRRFGARRMGRMQRA